MDEDKSASEKIEDQMMGPRDMTDEAMEYPEVPAPDKMFAGMGLDPMSSEAEEKCRPTPRKKCAAKHAPDLTDGGFYYGPAEGSEPDMIKVIDTYCQGQGDPLKFADKVFGYLTLHGIPYFRSAPEDSPKLLESELGPIPEEGYGSEFHVCAPHFKTTGRLDIDMIRADNSLLADEIAIMARNVAEQITENTSEDRPITIVGTPAIHMEKACYIVDMIGHVHTFRPTKTVEK